MERLPNRYPKISQSHKVPLYKGLSLFYPKLQKKDGKDDTKIVFVVSFLFLCMEKRNEKIRIWEKEKKAESA